MYVHAHTQISSPTFQGCLSNIWYSWLLVPSWNSSFPYGLWGPTLLPHSPFRDFFLLLPRELSGTQPWDLIPGVISFGSEISFYTCSLDCFPHPGLSSFLHQMFHAQNRSWFHLPRPCFQPRASLYQWHILVSLPKPQQWCPILLSHCTASPSASLLALPSKDRLSPLVSLSYTMSSSSSTAFS